MRLIEVSGEWAQSDKCRACGMDGESEWRSGVHRRLNLLLSRMDGVDDKFGHVEAGMASMRGMGGESEWRSGVDRRLNLLLTRMDGLDDKLGNVEGGMASIRGLLEVMNKHSCKYIGHSNKSTVDMGALHVDVGMDTPSGLQPCVSQDNVGDTVVEEAPPSCPHPHPSPQPDTPRGSGLGFPILLDGDNGSSQSEEAKSTRDGPTTPAPAPASMTPNTVGKRVHSQPRARVVPCARNFLGVAAGAGKGDSNAGASTAPIPYAPKYKDPPGYDRVTDFGQSSEPYFKPPVLQPKTKGVSASRCLNYPEIMEYATHVLLPPLFYKYRLVNI